MADPYGTLIFTKSEDCVLAAEEMIKKLNLYKWAQDDTKWCYDAENDVIVSNSLNSQFPSVFPDKINLVEIEDEDGVERWVESNTVDFDTTEILDIEMTINVDLASLCADIAQAISIGWIEIGLAGIFRSSNAYFEILQIHADGRGIRLYCITGHQFPWGMQIEHV